MEAQAEGLTCLGEADREMVTLRLKSTGIQAGFNWTTRFTAHTSSFALWSGLVFSGVIGAALWASRIPSLHAPAALTAAAYLVIAVVAFPACRRQARRILDQFSRISADAPKSFLLLYISVLTGLAILFSIVNEAAENVADIRHVSWLYYLGEFAAFVTVTALGYLLAYLLLAYAYASALLKPETSQTLSWAGTLAAAAFGGWFPALHRSPVPVGNPYLDSGLLRLLGCTATIERMGRGPALPDARTVRSVIIALEFAAADLERYAVDRVPWLDTTTRRLVRQDGARLASVVRNAKAPMARAVHPSDYSTIAAKLGRFLLAWARSEPNGLTALADSDSITRQVSLWRRAAGRFWNAMLLTAAAIGLPLLPIYNNNQAAAAGLRYALLTAAVLALAAQGSPASGIIESTLEKTLPGGNS